MHSNLDLDLDSKIGNYDQAQVYHVEEIKGNFWFALTNFSDYNELKVVSPDGIELSSYISGINLVIWLIGKGQNSLYKTFLLLFYLLV